MISSSFMSLPSVFKAFFILFIFIGISPLCAQQQSQELYQHSSEMTEHVIRYYQDVRTLKDFYSPRAANRFSYQTILNSPFQRQRLEEVNQAYLKEIDQFSFDQLRVNGQVDYILLKNQVEKSLEQLAEEETNYQEIVSYIPFSDAIYGLEARRLRGSTLDGEQVATQLNKVATVIKQQLEAINEGPKIDMKQASFAQESILALQARLKNVYDFYNEYDPLFSWWVPITYHKVDSLLGQYAKKIVEKGEIRTGQKADDSGIKGNPIGGDELNKQLRREFIPYTPQELIALANQEFAWCDNELLKASAEMGFGKDWKQAQEQVKNSYVEPGKQPELIIKLYNDAKSFITERDWITWPELADETWGMIMMTPERQLVNPFFTGGREISISYPTQDMTYEDKMMSMRGNNPYFSRGTVQHELIPGHHLQYFMNSRYKPYRSEFRTPFYTEGWSLYWELLLYEHGFAKTPEERIGMLFWRMHRCARIIFSLNYHLGKWSPQECIDFLVDRVGFERANAEGEVRRSFQGNYPPLYQAAYLLGGIQIMGLKRELVDNGKMSIKEFHDAFMRENQLPIELMRAILANQELSKDFKTSWKFYDFK
ncbi:DUF885 family protein [Olivibacter sp. SDN3]|uniref:DUF885 family protein n=1 Tax=Olivibacter sp. SDN3 TaxID=2764720 RepID=UPI00165187DB|nr:DUF885 family protein [Olivibacter sp. SDN3]QNL50771.1 DUF885 family protein [Olivibacter sp. SDN3]